MILQPIHVPIQTSILIITSAVICYQHLLMLMLNDKRPIIAINISFNSFITYPYIYHVNIPVQPMDYGDCIIICSHTIVCLVDSIN